MELRKGLLVGMALFWFGSVLKMAHWPFAGATLILGCIVMTSHALRWLLVADRSSVRLALLSLSFATLHVFLLFRFQFWPFSIWPFVLAWVVTLLTLILHFFSGRPLGIPSASLLVLSAFSILIFFTPAYKIHGRKWFEQTIQPDDYHYWHTQSWFLNLAGQHAESMAAMDSAMVSAHRAVRAGRTDTVVVDRIAISGLLLAGGNWHTYISPEPEPGQR